MSQASEWKNEIKGRYTVKTLVALGNRSDIRRPPCALSLVHPGVEPVPFNFRSFHTGSCSVLCEPRQIEYEYGMLNSHWRLGHESSFGRNLRETLSRIAQEYFEKAHHPVTGWIANTGIRLAPSVRCYTGLELLEREPQLDWCPRTRGGRGTINLPGFGFSSDIRLALNPRKDHLPVRFACKYDSEEDRDKCEIVQLTVPMSVTSIQRRSWGETTSHEFWYCLACRDDPDDILCLKDCVIPACKARGLYTDTVHYSSILGFGTAYKVGEVPYCGLIDFEIDPRYGELFSIRVTPPIQLVQKLLLSSVTDEEGLRACCS